MQQLLYADLGKHTVSDELGGGDFSWPSFIQGDKLVCGIRMQRTVDGEAIETVRTVTGLKATLGQMDARPTGGTFALYLADTGKAFTASGATLTSAGHGLSDGQRVRLESTGSLPAGLRLNQTYYLVSSATDTFSLAATSGGAAITTTSGGSGTHKIVPISAAIAFDATGATVAAAINALPDAGSIAQVHSDATATAANGSWIVEFPGRRDSLSLLATEVKLDPKSLVRIREYSRDSQLYHEVRLIQAPVAFTSTFARIVPPAPTITAVLDGSTNEGIEVNEVQALEVDPTFRGSFRIRRGSYQVSAPITAADGPEAILAAIESLADVDDDDAYFIVTNPMPNVAHIEFAGSMGGTNQSLLTVEVHDAPVGDLTFELSLNTAEVSQLLRDSTLDDEGEVEVPFEIEIQYEDPNDDEDTYTWTYSTVIKLRRELTWEELGTAPSLDWTSPPDGTSYVPWVADQVITGSQHYETTLGDGANTEFELTHSLGTDGLHVTIRENSPGGALLTPGVDYTVTFDSDNVLTVDTSAWGTPTAAQLAIVITAAGPASAFQSHNHTIAQVTGLQDALDAIGADILALQALAPSGVFATRAAGQGATVARWTLPPWFEIFPTRRSLASREGVALSSLDPALLPRLGGLLPAVHDAAVETLPAPLPTTSLSSYVGNVYENEGLAAVTLPGFAGRKSESLAPGEFAACDGRGWYRVAKVSASESSYYPTDFDRDLFTLAISPKQLRHRGLFEVQFALEMAVFGDADNEDVQAQYVVALQLGDLPADSTPGTPGLNLQNVDWDSYSFDVPVVLTRVPTVHTFGYRLQRSLSGETEVLTATNLLYGAEEAGVAASAATFASKGGAIRARLIRFDTENSTSQPKGLVAVRGFADSGGISAIGSAAYGEAIVKA